MRRWLVLGVACAVTGCPEPDSSSEGPEAGTTEGADDSTGTSGDDTVGDDTAGDPLCDAIDPGGLVTEEPMIPEDCEEPLITNCKADEDRDGVVLGCDNAPGVANPGQRDADGDGNGDAVDLCPVVVGPVVGSMHDTDGDGIGTPCDSCPGSTNAVNTALEAAGVPHRYWVRDAPIQNDFDGDGVGDACDNCPTPPNCAGFTGTGAG